MGVKTSMSVDTWNWKYLFIIEISCHSNPVAHKAMKDNEDVCEMHFLTFILRVNVWRRFLHYIHDSSSWKFWKDSSTENLWRTRSCQHENVSMNEKRVFFISANEVITFLVMETVCFLFTLVIYSLDKFCNFCRLFQYLSNKIFLLMALLSTTMIMTNTGDKNRKISKCFYRTRQF